MLFTLCYQAYSDEDSSFDSTEDPELKAKYEEARKKGLVTDSLLETSSDDWSSQNKSSNQTSTKPSTVNRSTNHVTTTSIPAKNKNLNITKEQEEFDSSELFTDSVRVHKNNLNDLPGITELKLTSDIIDYNIQQLNDTPYPSTDQNNQISVHKFHNQDVSKALAPDNDNIVVSDDHQYRTPNNNVVPDSTNGKSEIRKRQIDILEEIIQATSIDSDGFLLDSNSKVIETNASPVNGRHSPVNNEIGAPAPKADQSEEMKSERDEEDIQSDNPAWKTPSKQGRCLSKWIIT